MTTGRADVVRVSDLRFGWGGGHRALLEIHDLRVRQGERLFIAGASGSGKSTLLSLLGGVIQPQHGEIRLMGQRIDRLGSAARDRFRADHVGMVFQMFNLIPYLSMLENVLLPCRFSALRRQRLSAAGRSPKQEAMRLLAHLRLSDPDLLARPVTELSVGQQQRVAAARALIGAPELLIADEPTSALDAAHRLAFIELLFRECAEQGASVLFVSHDATLKPLFDRSIDIGGVKRGDAHDQSE
jgi:putative ABC transport system ATP-binding protein